MDSKTSSLRIRHYSSCSCYDEGRWWCISTCRPLVHQYNTTAARLHIDDVTNRQFSYIFDFLIRCTNPRRVIASDTLSTFITTSSVTSLSVLYHSPIELSPVFPIILIPSIALPDTNYRVLSFPVVPPSNITGISFDSVIYYFASILLT